MLQSSRHDLPPPHFASQSEATDSIHFGAGFVVFPGFSLVELTGHHDSAIITVLYVNDLFD